MPRGVYQRKSASADKAPVVESAQVLTDTPVAATPSAPIPEPAAPMQDDRFIRGSVENMSGDLLKRYARQVGVMQRDIDGLSEDRLRQNCKAMIFAAMEED